MASTRAGLLALFSLWAQPTISFEEVEVALASDEECAAGNHSQCALNALQKRIARVVEEQEAFSMSAEHPMLKLELFRALRKKDLVHDFSNVDLASPAGVMNYLHTDVVAEHVDDYAGYQPKIGLNHRMNGVDTIVGINARVKNPESVLNAVGNFVDFALSALFISGEATGPAYNWNFGDIVGAQKGEDPRWPLSDPYYRFSLSGFCPNLKWNQKKKGAIAAIKKHKHDEDGQAPPPETGRRRRRQPGMCMTYSNQFHLPFGEILRGGLCPNGTTAGKLPTGLPGCIYTYEPPKTSGFAMVDLDEVVGITREDCDGRLCRNWRDWRRHCSNKKYHRKFNYKSRRRYSTILRSRACVEYDIHKACAKSCDSRACKKVPARKRELGLPFWKGRCSAHMNAQRSERLAVMLGIKSASKTHQLLKAPSAETCLSPNSELCHPNATMGGMYCSRLWGGICQPCYVPGTVAEYVDEQDETRPICPWSIFEASSDYKSAAMQPKCASDEPKDLCCLYTGGCNKTYTTEPLPITDNGFAVVSSKQDTKAMVSFLKRAALEAYGAEITNEKKLAKMAHWQWGLAPIKGKSLASVMAIVKHYFI